MSVSPSHVHPKSWLQCRSGHWVCRWWWAVLSHTINHHQRGHLYGLGGKSSWKSGPHPTTCSWMEKKSVEIRICYYWDHPQPTPLILEGQEVPVVTTTKYIGFHLDSNLSGDTHMWSSQWGRPQNACTFWLFLTEMAYTLKIWSQSILPWWGLVWNTVECC